MKHEGIKMKLLVGILVTALVTAAFPGAAYASSLTQAGASLGSVAPVAAAVSNRYQGKGVSVSNPGKQTAPESDLTRAQMAQLMGSSTAEGVSYTSVGEVARQLETYWLPNANRQLTSTFRSFHNIKQRTVLVGFSNNVGSTFGTTSWARCTYYGYGNSGADNHMGTIAITLDQTICLDTSAKGQVSGTSDLYTFDQIIAHELTHAYLAEIAPGYVLGSTEREWFTEGVAEMANGGVAHMAGRNAYQLCSSLGAGYVDYGGSYLAVSYASWLSANKGYGGTCTVSAANLAYGLDRIMAQLRESGNLNTSLQNAVGMSLNEFEFNVRFGHDGRLQQFLDSLYGACRNSEGTLGCGSVIGGNLKLQKEFVVANRKSSLSKNDAFQYTISY